MVALSKVIRWEVGQANEFDRTLTPEEIMDKLEQRVGPEGRKLFEQFLRKVNKLQAQQQLGRAGTDRTRMCRFPASGSSRKSFARGCVPMDDPGCWQWVTSSVLGIARMNQTTS